MHHILEERNKMKGIVIRAQPNTGLDIVEIDYQIDRVMIADRTTQG